MGAMNVYAEVRGKYSRNANNTANNIAQASGIVSRPSTSGSLMNYSRRSFGEDHKKEDRHKEVKKEEEPEKPRRPLNNEEKLAVKKRRYREKDSASSARSSVEEDIKGKKADREKADNEEEGLSEVNEEENRPESGSENDTEKDKEEADKVTEVSFKTTSSQRRYIEELEQMLKEERIRRIKAEGELERLSSRKSWRKQ